MKSLFIFGISLIAVSQAGAYLFDTTVTVPPSNLHIAQSWTRDIANNPPTGLPRPAADIIEDRKNHSTESVELNQPQVLELKPVSIFNSYTRIGVRYEVVFGLPISNGNPWTFRGVPVISDRCEIRLENSEGAIIETTNLPLSQNGDGTQVLSLGILPIDPESQVYAEKRAYIRLYNGDGSLLASHQVTWDCVCKDCGAATGESRAGIGSVEYEIPITSIRNGRTPLTFEYHAQMLANEGRGSLVFNGPQGSGSDNAVAITRNGAGEIDSITVGNLIATVTDAPNTADPERFIVTVSTNKLDAAATVYRTVVFENPLSTATSLEITETLLGKVTQAIYQKPNANTWQLTTGNNLRRMTESTDLTTLPNHEIIRRTLEERKNVGEAYQAVSDVRSTRKKCAWGWETILEVIDPDGLALTTTWDFYEGVENTGPPGTPSTVGLGRLQSLTRYDGKNELHYYSAPASLATYQRIHETHSPFAGVANGRKIIENEGFNQTTQVQTTRVETFIGATQIGQTTALRDTLTGITTTRDFSDAAAYLESQTTETTYDPVRTQILPDGTRATTGEFLAGTLLKYRKQKGTFNAAAVQNSGDYQIDTVNEQGYVIIMDHADLTSTTSGYQTKEAYATSQDAFGRPLEMSWFLNENNLPAYTTQMEYSCCGLSRERDKYGVDTFYGYDSLRRMVKTNRLGITTETVYAGRTMSTHRYPENAVGGLSAISLATADNEISRSVSNLVGDVIETWARTAANGSLVKTTITTSYAPAAGLSRRVTTQPPTVADDGAALPLRGEEYFLDGQPYQETGNLAPNMRYAYAANATGLLTEKSYLDATSLRETTTTQWDWLNREVKMTYPSDENADSINDFSATFYNSLGQLSRSIDPDGGVTLYGYNALGTQTTVATDMNGNNLIDLAVDRVSFSETRANYNGFPGKQAYVERTRQSVRLDDAGSPIELTTLQEDRSYDGLRSWSGRYPGRLGIPSTQFGAETVSISTLGTPGNWTVRSTAPDATYTITTHTAGRLATQVSYDQNNKVLYTLSYGYADPLFRLKSVTDSRTGTTSYTYVSDTVDVVKSTTDPIGRMTSYTFDTRDRKISTDLPDTQDADGVTLTNITTSHYFPDGMLQESTGAQTYRSTYTYDYAQRLSTLTTYGTATAITRWEYDINRGLLRTKRHDSSAPGIGSGPSYSYTPAGRVKSRTWARLVAGQPLVTSYTYHPASSDLVSTLYSDTTPSVTISTRDRLGRITAMTDAAGLHTYTHKLTGPMLTDATTGSGPLAGFTLTQTPDNLNRPSAATLTQSGSLQHAVGYGYDSAGRLGSMSHNGRSAKYSYHPTRQTLALTSMIGTTGKANLQHERIHDNAGRLQTIISHRNATGNPASYQPAHLSKYTLNALDQRTAATELDDRSWGYGYNPTGEITRAVKTITSTGAALEGRNFRYAFDGIGNRTSAQSGGDAAAANLRTANYTPNALNQYTAITHPGFLEIYGKAPIAQAVTVNGLATTRQGRDFRRELSFPNPTQRWESIVTNGGSLSTSQHHLPAASTTPTYDLDGNQTSDGQWSYTWDAENRLSTATRTVAALASGAPYRAISYIYDSRSRKIIRSVATTSGGAITTEKFLYDGWNCIAEYTGTTLKKSYLWGMDLSGTLQSAGGVGGLLLITDHSAPLTSHYPCYDGNGNIRKLIHATTLATTATYDYAPFGKLTRATGPYAATNSYRFSTKPQDTDTGLVYYTTRHYDTGNGRWLSRDKIEEQGGYNLYSFLGNRPTNAYDVLGYAPGDTIKVEPCEVFVYYGHLSRKKPLKWDFNGRCALGGAIGCFPASNNPPDTERATPANLPPNHQIPGFPIHDDEMVVGDGDRRIVKNRRDLFNGSDSSSENEHGMPWALENLSGNVESVMDKLCKSCCQEVKFIIRIDSTGDNSDLQDGIERFAPSWKGRIKVGGKDFTKTIKCGTPAKLP